MVIPTPKQTIHLMTLWEALRVRIDMRRNEGQNARELELYTTDDLRRLYQNTDDDLLPLRDGIISRIQLVAEIRCRVLFDLIYYIALLVISVVAAIAAVIGVVEGWNNGDSVQDKIVTTPPGVPSAWAVAAPYVVAIIAALAALTAAYISHNVKISEFRQKWIDALRQDISDYLGASERWFRLYLDADELSLENEAIYEEKKFEAENQANIIIWRIKLRVNPRINTNKNEDDRFLSALDNLLDPSKLTHGRDWSGWWEARSNALELARELLKREWQITKKFTLISRK